MNATELLREALDEEDAERVAEAIRQGADVNGPWDDQTMLSAAVQIADTELINLLLAADADPNRSNDDGTTAFTWCANAELTALLLDAGASARYEGEKVQFSPLHNAAVDGDVERLRLLLERGEGRCLLDR